MRNLIPLRFPTDFLPRAEKAGILLKLPLSSVVIPAEFLREKFVFPQGFHIDDLIGRHVLWEYLQYRKLQVVATSRGLLHHCHHLFISPMSASLDVNFPSSQKSILIVG
jgi:hypothetical protein